MKLSILLECIMSGVDHKSVLSDLRAISGHGAWHHENGRYSAVQIPSSDSYRFGRVRGALANAVADGCSSDITSERRVPHSHPDLNEPMFFDSVSVGEDSIDYDQLKLRRAQHDAKVHSI